MSLLGIVVKFRYCLTWKIGRIMENLVKFALFPNPDSVVIAVVCNNTNGAINLYAICGLWPLSATKRKFVTTGRRLMHDQIGRAESVSVGAAKKE
jgi:hypothetical protein